MVADLEKLHTELFEAWHVAQAITALAMTAVLDTKR